MGSSILVLDPNPGFAGMVQQALQEAGHECHVAQTDQEALRLASSVEIDLAILDLELPEGSPEELVGRLRAIHPGLTVVGIPPDNDPHHPLVGSLKLEAVTTKPFYLPDFLPLIRGLLQARAAHRPEAPTGPPAGLTVTEIHPPESSAGAISKAAEVLPSPLQDPRYAQDLLASLQPTIGATACLLSRSGQVWATSGDLSPAEAQAAAEAVSQNWSPSMGGVVVRYLSVPPREEDYLLYSTSAPAGMHLTLVFDAWQPSARMRVQAKQILTALQAPLTAAEPGKQAPAQPSRAPAEEPLAKSAAGEAAAQGPQTSAAGVTRRLQPEDIYTMGTRRLQPEDIYTMGTRRLPSWQEVPERAFPGSAKPASAGEGSEAEAGNIRLTYHLMLSPADEALRLVPEVASDLEGFTRNLVVALGCRPTRVSAHPDYLLVSFSAPPAVLPSLIVGRLRSMTTDHLLGRFPSLAPQSQTEDFWARSHLLTTQEQPPTPGQIANFLTESHPARRAGRPSPPSSSPL